MRLRFFLPFFIVLVLIALLHVAGLSFYFYWRVPFYDRIVHGLSGWLVGYTALGIFFAKRKQENKDQPISMSSVVVISVGAALFVGIGWEIFELVSRFTHVGDRGYIFDTTLDIVSDVVGGLLVACGLFLSDQYANF